MNDQNKPLWISILTLAAPMVLSMTGVVLMQFVDALFLSWYSPDAISAVVPAGMASWLLICPFQGTAAYTSTLVAHYEGAGKSHRAFAATWQGLYFSIFSGVVIALLGFTAGPIFAWAGHAENIRGLEIEYFQILCWFGIVSVASGALSGYFSGKGRTGILMVMHLIGFGVNALLAWILIFGKFGFPVMGITGAALATVIAQLVTVILLAILFLLSREEGAHPWLDRTFDKELFWRLFRFGFPNGLRYGFEMLAWTLFIFFLGRIGPTELAASNIAFRINGFAFFPIIGLGQAIGVLVGQAQGRKDSTLASRVTITGFFMAEGWMIFMSAIFLLFPHPLLDFFKGNSSAAEFAEISAMGITILRFVALYSILDACNIIFVSSLQSAGDTKWTMIVSIIAHVIFLSSLALIDFMRPDVWMEWAVATLFIWVVAFTWFFRFKSGKWKNIQVIEEEFDDEQLAIGREGTA